MRADGKARKTVYVGNGVKSVEWVEPKKSGKKSEMWTDKKPTKKSD